MKKLALVVGVLLAAQVCIAADYTVTLNTAQVTKLDKARVTTNTDTCASVKLPANCTEAQAQAINASLEVYTNSSADIGRFLRRIALDRIENVNAKKATSDEGTLINTIRNGNATLRQNVCTAAGLASTCFEPVP